jgi:L-lactate dehydrogenase
MMNTKIGIVGAGLVGSTAANALALRGSCAQVVLVDKDEAKAKAQALDIAVAAQHGVHVSSGSVKDLKGASAVILALGINQKPGQTRLEQFENSSSAFGSLVPQILEVAPDAVLIVASQPLEPMTELASRLAGAKHHQIIGTGTVVQTARLRTALATKIGVHPDHVHAHVIGEMSGAGVIAWSNITIAGLPLKEHLARRGMHFSAADQLEIADEVKHAALRIVDGKGERHFGVGAALARIAEVVANDERAVLTVTASTESYGVALAMPRLIGRAGVIATLEPDLNDDEKLGLEVALESIRRATWDVR